jgi:hypothetical protein
MTTLRQIQFLLEHDGLDAYCPLSDERKFERWTSSLSNQVVGVVWKEGQPIKTSSKMGDLYQFSSLSNSVAPPL